MHYTQNDKIRQATEGTIVVGVDIGSEKNYARTFNLHSRLNYNVESHQRLEK